MPSRCFAVSRQRLSSSSHANERSGQSSNIRAGGPGGPPLGAAVRASPSQPEAATAEKAAVAA